MSGFHSSSDMISKWHLSLHKLVLVNGVFSEWDDWTECTVLCGGGSQTRSRTCDNPAPQFGGLPCDGEVTECQACNVDPCPSACPA